MLSEEKSLSEGEEIQKDLKLHQPEPFNLRHHQSKEETKLEKPKRRFSLPAILVTLFILIITAAAIGSIFYVKHSQTKVAAINNFEDCVAAGNPIMESYPEQCSANGQTFTRVLTEEEKKKLSSDPMADWSISDSTENDGWKKYSNTKYGYGFEIPSTWKIGVNEGVLEMFILESSNYSDDGRGSVIEITTGTDLEVMSIEEQLVHYDPATVKTENIKVDNISAVKLGYDFNKESNFAQYHTQFINEGVSYDLDFFSWDEESFNSDMLIYDKFLSAFKFTPLSTSKSTDSDDASGNWRTYTNQEHNFSLMYPSDWKRTGPVADYDATLAYINSPVPNDGQFHEGGPFVWIVKEKLPTNAKLETIEGKNLYTYYETPGRLSSLSVYFKTQDGEYISLNLQPFTKGDSLSQSSHGQAFVRMISSFKFNQ